MPLVTVKLIEGVFTSAQKRDMIHKLTETMVSIEGENLRPLTLVVVEEVKSGDWGVGGRPITTAEAKSLAAGSSTGGPTDRARAEEPALTASLGGAEGP